MSTLSVTTINSANGTTDFTATSGNTAAAKIVFPSTGGFDIYSNSTYKAMSFTSGGNINCNGYITVNNYAMAVDSPGYSEFTLDTGVNNDYGYFQCKTTGTLRWAFGSSNETESGSNLGSNFNIWRYSDGGAAQGGAPSLSIARSTGYLNIPGVYAETDAGAANIFVDTDGSIRRSTSSLRYKTSITSMTYGLEEVLKLRPVTYESKREEDTKRYGGLIAEEVDAAGLKEFVGYDTDGQPDSLHYGHMVSLCIKAIQDQQRIIDDLILRIEELEKQ